MKKIDERKLKWEEYYRASPFDRKQLEVSGEDWFKYIIERYTTSEFIDLQMYLLANINCLFKIKNDMTKLLIPTSIIIEVYA